MTNTYRDVCLLWTLGLAGCGGHGAETMAPAAGELATPQTLGGIQPLFAAGDRLLFGGQPRAEDIPLLAAKGVKTVINLRTDDEMAALGFDERAVVEQAGMRYVQVPIGGEALDAAARQRLFAALDAASGEPLLLHCASSNRVGYAWALYRALHQGASTEQAVAEAEAAGISRMRQRLLEELAAGK